MGVENRKEVQSNEFSLGPKKDVQQPFQGHKKTPTALFSPRSRIKLDNARKLVKPELLDDEANSKSNPASISDRTNINSEDEKKLENKLSDNSEGSLGQESVVKSEWKTAKSKNNEERISKPKHKQGRAFTPQFTTSAKQEENPENNVLESSTEVFRNEKSKAIFKPRSKLRVENVKSEIDNSIGKHLVSSRVKKITDDVPTTTRKPRKTSPRRSVKNPEENYKVKSRESPVSRYQNTVKNPITSEKFKYKSSILRGSKNHDSTIFNPIRMEEETTTIPSITSKTNTEETTINPLTAKNHVYVTKSVSSKITQEVSTKRMKATDFNNLAQKNIDNDDDKSKKLDQVPNEVSDSTTAKRVRPTSRYSRKKISVSKKLNNDSNTSAPVIREGNNETKRREFRPRTATYRRHSEVPLEPVRSSTAPPNSISITPKANRFQFAATSSSSSPLPVMQEPIINVQVSNNSNSSQQQSIGVSNISNKSSRSTESNIFNPTRSFLVTSGNATLLEQIRSTVAPLLSSLAARSPIFAGIYNNATNIVRFLYYCYYILVFRNAVSKRIT